MDRRRFLLGAGVTAAALAVAPTTAAGASDRSTSSPTASRKGRTIKIGYVSPASGELAEFGAADAFVLHAVRRYFGRHGVTVAGERHDVRIVTRDTASLLANAPAIADDLIENEKVDLVLASAHGRTTIPVANVCESRGVPCVSTITPWQSWLYGRGGDPTSFTSTFHFFWGEDDLISVFTDMWSQVATGKVVGMHFPDSFDGRALTDPHTGFPAAMAARGYTEADPGRFPEGATDFTTQIALYKSSGAQILTTASGPGGFAAFWKQAYQGGYRPKVATVAEALEFASAAEQLGDSAHNLGTEVWWSPGHPFTSSLTGQSARQLAHAYTAETGRQWTQTVGFTHAIFEVANAALDRAKVLDRAGITASLASLRTDTVVGRLDWTSGPATSVARTPLVGGQWRKGTDHPFDLVVVSNKDHPGIPRGGRMQSMA